MLAKEDLTLIGKVLKSHGTKGEVKLSAKGGIIDAADYLVCSVDGLFVPFYIEKGNGRPESGIVKFEGVDCVEDAERLAGAELYFEGDIPEEIDDEELSYSIFNGYKIFSENKLLGTILYIDDRTANVLATVQRPDRTEIDIPFNADFVLNIDRKKRRVDMQLPQGLLDL